MEDISDNEVIKTAIIMAVGDGLKINYINYSPTYGELTILSPDFAKIFFKEDNKGTTMWRVHLSNMVCEENRADYLRPFIK